MYEMHGIFFHMLCTSSILSVFIHFEKYNPERLVASLGTQWTGGKKRRSGRKGRRTERIQEPRQMRREKGRQRRVDFYRLHGTSRSNGELAVHRMIGSFPIVAHNQQYTPEHSRFQICRHGQLRLSICTQRGARPRERMHTHTHIRVRMKVHCSGESDFASLQ